MTTKGVPASQGLSCPCFVAVDLVSAYNNDGISYITNTADGDFDGRGMTFPAEELPASGSCVVVGGVFFTFPSKEDGQLNNISLEGGVQPVPVGRYKALHVLGASEAQGFSEEIQIRDVGGNAERVRLALSSCRPPFGQAGFGEPAGIRFDKMHFKTGKRHSGGIRGGCVMWVQTCAIGTRDPIAEIVWCDNPCLHVFAMTLERRRPSNDMDMGQLRGTGE